MDLTYPRLALVEWGWGSLERRSVPRPGGVRCG
jgi:hypothetical protein